MSKVANLYNLFNKIREFMYIENIYNVYIFNVTDFKIERKIQIIIFFSIYIIIYFIICIAETYNVIVITFLFLCYNIVFLSII